LPQRQKTAAIALDASNLPDLTPQQMEFVRHVLAGKTASDAYRAAYDCSHSTDRSIWALASRLRADVKVSSWLAAARQANLGSAVLTKEQHMQELERLREIALSSGNIGAAVAAEQTRGKVAGHHVERIQDITDRTDVVATLRDIAQLNPEYAAALAEQYGIEWAKPATETAH